MNFRLVLAFAVVHLAVVPAVAAEPQQAEDGRLSVNGFLAAYCVDCHSGEQPEGRLDLAKLQSAGSMAAEAKRWSRVLVRVREAEMPPADSDAPTPEEREQFLEQARASLLEEISAAGPTPGPAPLRRLNRTQYGATLRDLLGIEASVEKLLPDEGAGGEGFDNAAETLSISPLHAEKYLEAAAAAIDYALKDPRSRRVLLSSRSPDERRGFGRRGGPSPPAAEPAPTAETGHLAIRRFVPRAFRRPASDDEVARYAALFDAAHQRGDSFDQALAFALQGVLVSPHFLFRLEEPNPEPEPRLLGHYEIATRLSYFLWASTPDERLMRLAAEGRLNETDTLREEAARMLKDRKTRESVESFVEQWLGTRELGRSIQPEASTRRGGYSSELEWALKQEPVLFMQHILAENRPVLDLIDADYTFLDSKLARHYNVRPQGVSLNQQLVRVDLPEGSRRGGLLGMGGVLAVSSLPHRTSPVLRGKWVREALLGSPPPPPPPDVPELDEERGSASGKTIRELLAEHRRSAVCASCHNAIDPIGFGLENYDMLGRWRDEDGGQPIDAQGELPDGTTFDGPQELKRVLLSRKDDFVRHLTRKLLGYALGRGLTIEDEVTIEQIVEKVRDGDYRSGVLIAEIVCSVPFRYRASEERSPP